MELETSHLKRCVNEKVGLVGKRDGRKGRQICMHFHLSSGAGFVKRRQDDRSINHSQVPGIVGQPELHIEKSRQKSFHDTRLFRIAQVGVGVVK